MRQETKRGGGIPVPPGLTSPTVIDTDPRKPWSDYCSAPLKLVEGIVEGSTYRNQQGLAGCITTAFSQSMESLHVSSSAVSAICWVFHKPEENLDERGIGWAATCGQRVVTQTLELSLTQLPKHSPIVLA